MLMRELKEQKRISTRLYNGLCFRFKNTPNNLKEYHAMLSGYEALSYDEKSKITFAYIDKMNQQYANTSLEEVLKELNVSDPKDIMQFRNLGKISMSELQALIGGNQDEEKKDFCNKWLVLFRYESKDVFDIEGEFDTYEMASSFAYELVNEHPYAKYYLLEDKPL